MKDKIGILTSLICLIHCLVFPLLFSIFPAIINLSEWIEYLLIFIAFIFGFLSFYDNIKKHKYKSPLFLFTIGFLFIILSKSLEFEIINIFGLIFLIIAHLKNYLYIQKKDGCHPHQCGHNH